MERRRDIVSACLVALAKIGLSRDLGSLLRPFLKNPDQEIAETAVLCHGIAGLAGAVPDLVEILKDTPRGRKLLESPQGIHFRKRAFAAYALGLIANAHQDLKLDRTVFQAAKEILGGSRCANRDIPVSALTAVGLLDPDLSDPKGQELAMEASRYLLDYLKNRRNPFLARAHVPTALSRLLGRPPAGSAGKAPGDGPAGSPGAKVRALRKEALALMKGYLRRRKENSLVLQSCVLALGEMGDPKEGDLIELLEETSRGKAGRDMQVRFFANIALGYLGAAGARRAVDFLALRLRKRCRKMDRPWVALGLGVSQAELLLRGKPGTPGAGDVLVESFKETRNPTWRGAMAVALGLTQFTEAGPMVQKAMERSRVPAFKGYCAVALGLMKYKDALEDMRDMLANSLNEPDLLVQAAIGLGLMGEKSLVPDLLKALWKTPSNQDSQGALAQALGLVGDARCLPHLADMLFDENLPATTRSFAAAALGILGDPRPLPWNAPIAFGLNYRAAVETLTGGEEGILDIL